MNLDVTATDVPNLSATNDLYGMFCHCDNLLYNNTINNWDVSTITDMGDLFNSAYLFNQPLNNWNTSNVTNMYAMFCNALVFNQNIDHFITDNVLDMSYMFYNNLVFNQDISTRTIGGLVRWNTERVKDMSYMFRQASVFNYDISSWNTSSVVNMAAMFRQADAFNQNIGNWNTSKVRNMGEMFYRATHFNQDLSNWDVTSVDGFNGDFSEPNSMYRMFTESAFSSENYELTMAQWGNQDVKNGVYLSADGLHYCASKTQHDKLEHNQLSMPPYDVVANTKQWTIDDGGISCDYWTGGGGTSDWTNSANWGKGNIPDIAATIKDVTVATRPNYYVEATRNLVLESYHTIRNLTNEATNCKVIIPTDKVLTLTGKALTGAAEQLEIQSALNQPNGGVVFETPADNQTVLANVQFASKSKPATGT